MLTVWSDEKWQDQKWYQTIGFPVRYNRQEYLSVPKVLLDLDFKFFFSILWGPSRDLSNFCWIRNITHTTYCTGLLYKDE
jgi:hypothetical protein